MIWVWLKVSYSFVRFSLPPVAVEDLLLEESAVWAEEGRGVHPTAVGIQEAHVIALATHVHVGVVAWKVREGEKFTYIAWINYATSKNVTITTRLLRIINHVRLFSFPFIPIFMPAREYHVMERLFHKVRPTIW